MAVTDKQKAEVMKFVKRWKAVCQLATWKVKIIYATEPYADDPEISATMVTRYRYFEAFLTIYPPFWNKKAEAKERCIVHEFVHALLEELADLVNEDHVTEKHLMDICEKTTELVSRAIWFAKHGLGGDDDIEVSAMCGVYAS